MADEQEQGRPEGWSVPQRTPAIVAIAVLTMVIGMLLLASLIYDRTLRPRRQQQVTTFPAPGIETFIHEGARDPHAAASAPSRDPAIEAAKRVIVREGIPGWNDPR